MKNPIQKLPSQAPSKKKSLGKTNRNKGHNTERQLAAIFREIGFDKVCTTRMGSKLLDHCGIDLMNLPIIIQSKAGKQAGMKPANELKYIQDRMLELLPIDDAWNFKPKVLVHTMPAGSKRSEYDTIVSLTLKDFLEIVKLAYLKEKLNGD